MFHYAPNHGIAIYRRVPDKQGETAAVISSLSRCRQEFSDAYHRKAIRRYTDQARMIDGVLVTDEPFDINFVVVIVK